MIKTFYLSKLNLNSSMGLFLTVENSEAYKPSLMDQFFSSIYSTEATVAEQLFIYIFNLPILLLGTYLLMYPVDSPLCTMQLMRLI